MTKQEAIDLEKQCEEWIRSELKKVFFVRKNTLITVGLTFGGRLQITYDDFLFEMPQDLCDYNFHYIVYTGYWDDLFLFRQAICGAIQNHKNDFEKLIWSYENRRELED